MNAKPSSSSDRASLREAPSDGRSLGMPAFRAYHHEPSVAAPVIATSEGTMPSSRRK